MTIFWRTVIAVIVFAGVCYGAYYWYKQHNQTAGWTLICKEVTPEGTRCQGIAKETAVYQSARDCMWAGTNKFQIQSGIVEGFECGKNCYKKSSPYMCEEYVRVVQ